MRALSIFLGDISPLFGASRAQVCTANRFWLAHIWPHLPLTRPLPEFLESPALCAFTLPPAATAAATTVSSLASVSSKNSITHAHEEKDDEYSYGRQRSGTHKSGPDGPGGEVESPIEELLDDEGQKLSEGALVRPELNETLNETIMRGFSFRSLQNLFASHGEEIPMTDKARVQSPFMEAHTTRLAGHMVVIYCINEQTSQFSSHILLPILLLMKGIRKVTSDPVVILAERTHDLTSLIPEIDAQDPSIFANVEVVKGSGRHVDHLRMVGLHAARWVAVLAMPQEHMQFENDYDYDRDVIVVSHNVHFYLATWRGARGCGDDAGRSGKTSAAALLTSPLSATAVSAAAAAAVPSDPAQGPRVMEVGPSLPGGARGPSGVDPPNTPCRGPFTIVCLHKSENRAFLSFDQGQGTSYSPLAYSHSSGGRCGDSGDPYASTKTNEGCGHIFNLSFLDELFIKSIDSPALLDFWTLAVVQSPHRTFSVFSMQEAFAGKAVEDLWLSVMDLTGEPERLTCKQNARNVF